MRERPRDSGTSLLWAGVDSIWFITAPSATHAAKIGSSPQPTPGKSEPFAATTTTTTMSAQPATHAAARRQLRGRQPRSRTNPATSNGTASSTHTPAASPPTSAITPGSPFHSRNQNRDSPGTVDTSDMVILTCGSWLTGYARLPRQADLPERRAPGCAAALRPEGRPRTLRGARGGQRRRSRLRQGVARAAGRPVSRGLTPGPGPAPIARG